MCNLLLAWVLTLPMAIMLSATLYYVFATLNGSKAEIAKI